MTGWKPNLGSRRIRISREKLQREPHLTLFSLPTNKDAYDITSPALLPIEKAMTKQHIDQSTAVSDHFTLPALSMDNIELFPLELITSNRDAVRKARTAFLISMGKTIEPLGLNRRDEI